MKIKNFYLALSFLAAVWGLSGCTGGQESFLSAGNQAVCIINQSAIRAEAAKTGKWLASLNVGETVKLTGKPQADPADPKKEFYPIVLSDGNKGWVSAVCIVPGAKPGAVSSVAKIHQRPDLLSGTDKQLELMELVAVKEEKENWYQVIGENRRKSGWVPKDQVTLQPEDVVTAVLLSRLLRAKGDKVTAQDVETILASAPYPNNFFAQKIREKYSAADSTFVPSVPAAESTPAGEQPESTETMPQE